ncbi:MAG: RNA 2',3'-cyclic phosphodiesterase [Candidatus Dormiibacterota bacterium]
MRCFLAVPLEEPGLGTAQRLQADLRERVPEVRWARPETLHLTVHFFGQLDDRRAATALALVTPIAPNTFTFDVALDRLGAFPQRGTPHVLWLGPAGDVPELTALALECRDVLGVAGFDIEERSFHPHCTLGRPRMPWSETARAAWTAAVAESRPDVHFTASRLVLFESRSAPEGAIYAERSSLLLASR